MQISLKWINELVNIETIDLENLIEKLTLGGFEVEDVITIESNKKKQLLLDISATANRSDSLSVQGIASEIAILLNQSTKISEYSKKIIPWKENIQSLLVTNSNTNDYSIFLDTTTNSLFGVMKAEDPAKLADLPSTPIMQKWWKYMADIMETNADNSPVQISLKEVFYLP